MEWSRDRWRHVTLKGEGHYPTFQPNILTKADYIKGRRHCRIGQTACSLQTPAERRSTGEQPRVHELRSNSASGTIHEVAPRLRKLTFSPLH